MFPASASTLPQSPLRTINSTSCPLPAGPWPQRPAWTRRLQPYPSCTPTSPVHKRPWGGSLVKGSEGPWGSGAGSLCFSQPCPEQRSTALLLPSEQTESCPSSPWKALEDLRCCTQTAHFVSLPPVLPHTPHHLAAHTSSPQSRAFPLLPIFAAADPSAWTTFPYLPCLPESQSLFPRLSLNATSARKPSSLHGKVLHAFCLVPWLPVYTTMAGCTHLIVLSHV